MYDFCIDGFLDIKQEDELVIVLNDGYVGDESKVMAYRDFHELGVCLSGRTEGLALERESFSSVSELDKDDHSHIISEE